MDKRLAITFTERNVKNSRVVRIGGRSIGVAWIQNLATDVPNIDNPTGRAGFRVMFQTERRFKTIPASRIVKTRAEAERVRNFMVRDFIREEAKRIPDRDLRTVASIRETRRPSQRQMDRS